MSKYEILVFALFLLIVYLFFLNYTRQEYFSNKFQTKGEIVRSARSISPRVMNRGINRTGGIGGKINRPIRSNYPKKPPGNTDGSRPRYSGKNRRHRNHNYYGGSGYYGYPWYCYDYISPWSWYNYYYDPYDYDILYEPDNYIEDEIYYDDEYLL